MQSYESFLRDIKKYNLSISVADARTGYRYCNGCGAKGGFHFPSTIWFVVVEAACNIHDIKWQKATSIDDLLKANEDFDNDLKKICDSESQNDITMFIRRMRIAKYVSGVEVVGTPAYAKERGFTE